jgi:hypothetical protein
MKTGKLLKFRRPGADIHAYLYREGARFKASLYVVEAARPQRKDAVETLDGESEARVEHDVRAWVDTHYPARR